VHRLICQIRWVIALTLIAGVLAVPLPSQAAPAEPTIVAANGTTETIDAIDPPSRTAGMLALYTPAFGPATKTNAFGAEAVLIKSATPRQYRVQSVCTVWDAQAGRCASAGNSTIPADGLVLSAAPGGTPDIRLFVRDHIKAGDLVTVTIPLRRTASRSLDAIDPSASSNPAGVDPRSGLCYPGCRGANQLILYSSTFGARTGTNDFGYEVTVVDGRVVARGGNNSPIPANGLVLSGHGSAGSWLSANTMLGANVAISGRTLTITIGPDAYIFNAQRSLDQAVESIAAARAACRDVPYSAAEQARDAAASLIRQANAALESGEDQAAIDLGTAAQNQANIARYRTIESRVVDGRGIWVRPTETSRAAIEQTLDRIAAAGLNIVFLETFYHGYTIFPSATAARYGIAAQRPQFAGIDPLAIWVEEAHERGIELHAWVENFYVGNDALGGPGPILSVHPEWAGVEREDVGKAGPQPSGQERGYYFLDPAIPAARQYLFDVYTEMLSRYAIDGLHLDYIRYPISLPLANSFSYSEYSRTAFQAQHGVDPYTITPEANPEQWAQWVAWRQSQITSYVGTLRSTIDGIKRDAALQGIKRDVALSAAVFPDEYESKIKKMQDWELWAQRGWLDLLTGMSFGSSAESIAADTSAMREAVEGKALIYTGIYSPFNGQSGDALLGHIEAIRAADGHGAALFDWAHLTEEHATALREGSLRGSADAPHSRPAAAVAGGVKDLLRRIEAVYLPQGCFDSQAATPLRNRLDEIARSLERADAEQGSTRARIEHARRRLAELDSLLSKAVTNATLHDDLRAELRLYDDVLGYAELRAGN
jgi:uncharacterized lipoprotein YddW (UPF0748 family)